jgi:hypothetical protein
VNPSSPCRMTVSCRIHDPVIFWLSLALDTTERALSNIICHFMSAKISFGIGAANCGVMLFDKIGRCAHSAAPAKRYIYPKQHIY